MRWYRFLLLLTLVNPLLFTGVYAGKKVQIAILPPGTTSPFHSQIAKGAQKQGEEMGFRIKVQAPERETDFNGQVNLMREFINQKVDAISVNAINERAIKSVLTAANKAKIPVFIHNSLTPIPGADIIEYIGYNQRNGGRACGEYAAKLLQGKGKVFILGGIPGFHQIERTKGFLEALRNYPRIKVVGEETAYWERERAINVAAKALKKYPDIDLFYANSDEMAIGAAIAAKSMRRSVYTIGIDGNPVTLDKITEGLVTATLGTYPDKIGAQIVLQVDKLLSGVKIPAFLETPAVVVDKKNLEDYKAGKLWSPPKEGLAEQLTN